MGQTGAKHITMGDAAQADGEAFLADQRLQGLVEMAKLDAPGPKIPPKGVAGKIAGGSQERLSEPDGFLKRKIFQAVKRIVVDEGAHGPILGNHLAGEADDAAKLHATGIACYFVHAGNSVPAV
jgi:hypothetical protein